MAIMRTFLSLSILMLAAGAVPAADPAPAAGRNLDASFARILEMEDRRSPGDGDLARYLAPGQPPEVRERAALAAGRIGAPPASPYLLLDLLKDRAARLRRMAVFALGEMDDVKAAPLLAASLTDADAQVRALAAEALGKLKDPASVPLLIDRLDDEDPQVAGMTLLALWKIDSGKALASLVSRAAAMAAAGQPDLRRQAVYFLMRTQMAGPEGDAPAAALRARAADRDALLRSWVARGLGASREAESTRTLLELAADADWRVRVNAFNGLKARPVEAAPERWKIYEKGLVEGLAPVAVSALSSLESYAGPEAAAALRSALSDPRPRWREVAALALAAREAAAAADSVAPLASDPVWSVRARAAEALALAQARDRVMAMAGDTDARVRSVVMEALGRLKHPEAGPALQAGLQDQDPYVRSAALGALPFEGRSAAEAIEAARAAYARAGADAANDARLAALEAMARLGGDAAREGLEAALRDPDYLVRRRAAEALRDVFHTDRFAVLEGPATRLSSEDYLEAVRRSRRRVTAAIETGAGKIRLELFPQDAPLTVDNFMRLARAGSLDGLAFHRVVPNFVIQDGDPRGDGNGGPPWQIRCEINMRRYEAGAVGMALSGKDTGGSQYFITHSPQPHLDGGYTVFGRVVSGQDIVDRMTQGETVKRVTVEESRAARRRGSS
jgi:cyclophilin family peptidyl-prolyl cis-trans isomerase